MSRILSIAFLISLATGLRPASAQTPGTPAVSQVPNAARGQRPPNPLREPHTEGYVKATELPDGAIPSPKADGNFILGATHPLVLLFCAPTAPGA